MLLFNQMCLKEISLYCLQAYRRRAGAGLDLDFFQQLHGAGLLRVQLRVQLEFGRLRACSLVLRQSLRATRARSSSSVRKLCSGVPPAAFRVAFLRRALSNGSAGATGSRVRLRSDNSSSANSRGR